MGSGVENIKVAHRKTMQNPLVDTPKGAISCKSWPKNISGWAGQNLEKICPQTRHLLCLQTRHVLCQQTRHLLCHCVSRHLPRHPPGIPHTGAAATKLWYFQPRGSHFEPGDPNLGPGAQIRTQGPNLRSKFGPRGPGSKFGIQIGPWALWAQGPLWAPGTQGASWPLGPRGSGWLSGSWAL